MKTAISTLFAVILLFISSVGMDLYVNHSVFQKNTDIENSKTTQTHKGHHKPLKSIRKIALNPEESNPPNSTNNHNSNDKGHVTDSFFGFKISDLIALLAALTAIGFGIFGLRQNRISNEKQNRAYIFVKSCKLSVSPNENTMKISVVYKNAGITPAYNLMTESKVAVRPHEELGGKSILEDNLQKPDEAQLFIAHEDSKQHNIGIAVSNYQMKALRDGLGCLKIHAKATYKDAFGKKQFVTYKFEASMLSPESKLNGEMIVSEEGMVSS